MSNYVELLYPATGNKPDVARESCALSKRLEESGDYEGATSALRHLWEGLGARPDTTGLNDIEAARLLLRVGTLSGYVGGTRQAEGAQDFASDMLSEAIRLFNSASIKNGEAEAHIELARCYFRKDEIDNGRARIGEALALICDDDVALKVEAAIVLSMLEAKAGNPGESMRVLGQATSLLPKITNDYTLGCFHMMLGNIYVHTGEAESRPDYIRRATLEYTAASVHLELAGHSRFCIQVEANHGNALQSLGLYLDAEAHLFNARRKSVAIKDRQAVALIDQTIANGKLAQEQYADAAKGAYSAVRAFRESEARGRLAEALTTWGTALARLGETKDAKIVLYEAMHVAELAGNLSIAARAGLVVLEEFTLDVRERGQLHCRVVDLFRDTDDITIARRMRVCATKIIKMALENINAPSGEEDNTPQVRSWEGFSLDREVKAYQARLIQQALDDAGGAVSKAAHLLGMKHHYTLRKKIDTELREFNIQCKPKRIRTANRKSRNLLLMPSVSFLREDALHLRVKDNSFADQGILEGHKVVVLPSDYREGDLVAVRTTSGEYYIGQICEDDGVILLEATDPKGENVSFLSEEIDEVIGRVVGHYSADSYSDYEPTH